MFRQGGQAGLEDPRIQVARPEEFGQSIASLEILVLGPATQKDSPPGGAQHGDRQVKYSSDEED